MADEQRQQLLSEFINVTGADEERANFFLQAGKWELATALSAFYDEGPNERLSHTDGAQQNSNTQTATTSSSRFATLSSYNKNESSEEDGEEGQAFYAGGSETSGQQILGPNKKKKKDITQSLFDAAKSHGAEVISQEPSDKLKDKDIFKGAGFKLGSNVAPSTKVGVSLVDQPPDLKQTQDVTIKFWKNGFSIDNGVLRDFNDPSNKDFLNSISKGEVPEELRSQVHGGEVHVNMEDHREEEYQKPKETLKAFSGTGHVLGSPVPSIITESSLPPAAAVNSLPSQPVFKVDESKPTTTIQIRLSDGTRLVTKFNTSNTVGDIRNVVRNARPGNRNFRLMTTFPNKTLEQDDVTIEAGKLQNAVIVQRVI